MMFHSFFNLYLFKIKLFKLLICYIIFIIINIKRFTSLKFKKETIIMITHDLEGKKIGIKIKIWTNE
jgi:hypothetical protein